MGSNIILLSSEAIQFGTLNAFVVEWQENSLEKDIQAGVKEQSQVERITYMKLSPWQPLP